MTLFYSHADGAGDLLLYALRLLFGSAMVVSIVLGYTTIRHGDVIGHRAWMMRAYAIGLGAGTQVLTLMVGELIAGAPSEIGRPLLMGAGWVINLAVAEWVIRKRPAPATLATPLFALPPVAKSASKVDSVLLEFHAKARRTRRRPSLTSRLRTFA